MHEQTQGYDQSGSGSVSAAVLLLVSFARIAACIPNPNLWWRMLCLFFYVFRATRNNGMLGEMCAWEGQWVHCLYFPQRKKKMCVGSGVAPCPLPLEYVAPLPLHHHRSQCSIPCFKQFNLTNTGKPSPIGKPDEQGEATTKLIHHSRSISPTLKLFPKHGDMRWACNFKPILQHIDVIYL